MTDRLRSSAPRTTRDAITSFLDAADQVAPNRNATWYASTTGRCGVRSRPTSSRTSSSTRCDDASRGPVTGRTARVAAVLSGDMAKIGEIGLAKVAEALATLFDGRTPEEFGAAVDEFLTRYRHPALGTSIRGVVYQPMLELSTSSAHTSSRLASSPAVGHRVRPPGRHEPVRSRARHGRRHAHRLPSSTATTTDDPSSSTANYVPNRHGQRKVVQVEHIYAQVGHAPLLAIGNSAGDRQRDARVGPQGNQHGGLAVLDRPRRQRARVRATEVEAATLAEDTTGHGDRRATRVR